MRMRFRPKKVLINPTWDQTLEHYPLMGFSHYLTGRVEVLLAFADEIVENLDKAFSGTAIQEEFLTRAESLMWLWTLGAYEVVRTMCQAKRCFSQKAIGNLMLLKKSLSGIRMPAAKMEKAGRKEPVTSSRSPTGVDHNRRDLLVNDPEDRNDVSARWILAEFDRGFSSISKEDVLARHEEAYTHEA
jgi:hypothetical protein